MSTMHKRQLPWGVGEVEPTLQIDPGPPLRIRCVVNGCERYLIPPTRSGGGEVCPEHGIRVHRSGTYSYADVRRNIIVAKETLARRIVQHPFKFEGRFHLEKSEDALTWNVFKSFQEARFLKFLASYLTGLVIDDEPRLFLWGIEQDSCLRPFDLLIAARKRFESTLPVSRPATEPDIICYLKGKFILLCEAKLSSPNTFYVGGSRKDSQSLTKSELISIYSSDELQMLDCAKESQAERVWPQLHRNTVFSEWMANAAGSGTKPYFANLTRRGYENDSFRDFLHVVRPEYIGQVCHVFWEDFWPLAGLAGGKLSLFQEYLLTKTLNLMPGLDLGFW